MPFQVTLEELDRINEDKDVKAFQQLGGANGIAKKVGSDLHDGIKSSSMQERAAAFGINKMPSLPPKSFWSMVWEQLQDPTLILLMGAATISTITGVAIPEEREKMAWIEGLAVWAAVVLVCAVGASNDYSKELQFRKLNDKKDEIPITVVRDGKEMQILSTDLLVGDVVVFDVGDKVVADSVIISGNDPKMDEASLTGETEPIDKGPDAPFCRSGTQIVEGNGKMLVVAVGPHSEWGKTLALVQTEQEETPLEEKLTVLATAIGKLAFIAAIMTFSALFIQYCFHLQGLPQTGHQWNKVLHFFILGITVVVMAVPEGLPLAVTIALAYSMTKMLQDNNFVRVLSACETMGGATAICSDKTGTLTENRMTVVEGWFGGKKVNRVPEIADVGEAMRENLTVGVSTNSKAMLIDGQQGRTDFVGNRTECAMLMMIRNWGADYRAIRESNPLEKLYAFTSDRKMASALVKTDKGFRLHNKGAAEIVLGRCVNYMDGDGAITPMPNSLRQKLLNEVVTEMAMRGLRTLCITYADFPSNTPASTFEEAPERDLTLMAIVGIKDPVRKEVPEAVKTCMRAGINVRMVTGDNIHTAKHIARECHILTDGTAMEGPVFRKLSEDDIQKQLPDMQVLARSTPEDKYVLVSSLQKQGEVVAVTGDGTNDAPALKKSDVGLSMGIAGTEVAKEASDIVILDDNFESIVLAVMWGRNVFNNIRKFLQFQLTINISAVLTTFIASVLRPDKEPPLNILQLLWINMIMDSLAALALATESPSRSLLNQKPNGREEALISSRMWIHIIGQSSYQIAIALIFMFLVPTVPGYTYPSPCRRTCSEWQAGIQAPCMQLVRPDPITLCPGGQLTCPQFETCNILFNQQASLYEASAHEADKKINSVFFNAYIWLQLGNLLNARKISDEWNIFDGIASSKVFLIVYAIILGLQVFIMEVPFMNMVFDVIKITPDQWLISIAIGFSCIIVGYLLRIFSRMVHIGQAREEKARMQKMQALASQDGNKKV
mmetsp:Transcript_25699/g.71910  ORF Transcript_25699/g.71910 Transcript_25699/m.71910 type:complete len:1007 (+) Transcript_25699:267-3287(+)|eukprot:CAMPEP_0117657060 /NCGR_PEP_ID=MMETSP0804-20121206/5131_1 /TAXON_ID=1074897 /ORGANISM="Tetraselmis astigmatica, Strain CCMP880" /LENGTH=1006 /DNA_ID=CAMNT_0005463493 /DNA_START=238 /DNA_END=3258 /DNA_ORIENTATION=-